MDNTSQMVEMKNAKAEGISVVQGGYITTSLIGFNADGEVLRFPALQFDPDSKLWEVVQESKKTRIFVKANFNVKMIGDLKFEDEYGQLCLPGVVPNLIKSRDIFFRVDDEKYQVIGTDKANCYFAVPKKAYCTYGDTGNGEPIHTFVGSDMVYVLFQITPKKSK